MPQKEKKQQKVISQWLKGGLATRTTLQPSSQIESRCILLISQTPKAHRELVSAGYFFHRNCPNTKAIICVYRCATLPQGLASMHIDTPQRAQEPTSLHRVLCSTIGRTQCFQSVRQSVLVHFVFSSFVSQARNYQPQGLCYEDQRFPWSCNTHTRD